MMMEEAKLLLAEFRYADVWKIVKDMPRDELPSEIPFDEIKEMMHLLDKIGVLSDSSDWKQVHESPGLSTFYRRYPDFSSQLSVKIDCTLEVCAMTLLSLIHEIDLLPLWFPTSAFVQLLEARTVRKPSPVELVIYVRTRPPWPLQEREQCNHYKGIDCLDDGYIAILCNSLADEIVPDAAPGAVRNIVMPPSGIIIRPVNQDHTRLEVVYTVDPRIPFVPEWLLNLVLGSIATSIVDVLKNSAAIVERDEYQTRINDPENAYYNHLRSRMGKLDMISPLST